MHSPNAIYGVPRSFRPLSRRHVALQKPYTRPSFAPKPVLDLKHMRQNPGLYEQNCIDRNYAAQSRNAWKMLDLHERSVALQQEAVGTRQRNNDILRQVAAAQGEEKQALLDEARALKAELGGLAGKEKAWHDETEQLALELPNLSSLHTPGGDQAEVIGHINQRPVTTDKPGKSHADIGRELDIIDFEASATTSGWGWYFLKNEGALLEQALIQYALSVAIAHGWKVVTPPSLVYAHIASACGFMPRDASGETQIYPISQSAEDVAAGKPALVLAGTAEIPFAGSRANSSLLPSDLPLKVIGPSRCYRAEAGARGIDTKGLYRVHEFTKVEMFAWTTPPAQNDPSQRFVDMSDSDTPSQTDRVFAELLSIQRHILTALHLPARILEMPAHDLGASASRKIDIEAFFPSRVAVNDGYGEVTSASCCTDYQTRRLNTRMKHGGWPETVNGTALAVPRVLAACLENWWDAREGVVRVPEVLRGLLVGGGAVIGPGKGP